MEEEKIKPFYLSKWVILPSVYFLLLLISKLLSPDTEIRSALIDTVDSIEKNLVYIADPVLSDSSTISLLQNKYNLFVFYVDERSFKENAVSFNRIADSLNWSEIHLIGEGIGGSVAIHLATNESIKSLTLLDANGVEELELLGGYHLNHAIYQAKVYWHSILFNSIPHFGLLNSETNKITRSKSQLASNQNELRELLTSINIPVAIIHTEKAKIPESVSIEHSRLLPQSRLQFLDSDQTATKIIEFLSSVEDGNSLTRETADPIKQEEAFKPFDTENSVQAEGRALIVLMLVIILSTFISEDLTCIGTGLMIAQGLIGFFPGTLACLLGIFIGDILLYLSGRWLASGALHKAPLKWFISEKDIQFSYQWFEAKGPSIIIASRFIPGTRFPTYFSAGAIGARFGMFMFYFGIASIIWTPILVGLAVLLGQEMIQYFSVYQDYALWVLLGVLTILFVVFKIIIPSFTYKGRRLLYGKYKRRRHWEFWPPFFIYLPVIIYIFFVWIKYRSISLVTLANPGIKDGGFINESKSEILDNIGKRESIARYKLIKVELSFDEKKDAVRDFIESNKLDYPLVLKPDRGERGKGVVIPKNETQFDIELRKISSDFIVQEYIDGKEYGIFYARFPNQKEGQIYSITQKKYMWLEGDGKRTLEELILDDPRAVCLAEKHFEQHVEDLFTVPKKGKKIPLVEVGTHARGSIFYDAINLNTDHLLKRIDEISKSMPGFYFGRFDVKVPTEQHLKDGNELKILELNGITSEATHIYDPKYNYFYGVRVLMNQWSMAYKIAAEVLKQNPKLKPPGLVHLLNLIF